MEINLINQVLVFLLSIILGALLGVFYDFICVIKLTLSYSKLYECILDIIYFCLISVFTFLFVIAFNFGKIRFYIIIGVFIGLFAYHKIIGLRIVKLIRRIILFFQSVFLKIKKVFFVPIANLIKNVFYKCINFTLIKKFFKINNNLS